MFWIYFPSSSYPSPFSSPINSLERSHERKGTMRSVFFLNDCNAQTYIMFPFYRFGSYQMERQPPTRRFDHTPLPSFLPLPRVSYLCLPSLLPVVSSISKLQFLFSLARAPSSCSMPFPTMCGSGPNRPSFPPYTFPGISSISSLLRDYRHLRPYRRVQRRGSDHP